MIFFSIDNLASQAKQDRNINILDGTTVENKGKLILTEIFPSVQKHVMFFSNSKAFHKLMLPMFIIISIFW